MKKITYTAIFFLILGATIKCFPQQYTPNCTQIYPIYPPPLTQAQINSANSQQQAQHPNVVKLDEPTSSYNCHNYAWVKRDGGATFWLNTPDDDSFWNDASYTQVTTNTNELELRVSYAGDHSAVITGPSYQCTSKWGAWGLYRHNINDVPASYLPSSTKYFYKKNITSISGPSQICTTANYSLVNLPTGATITWSVTGTYSISGSNTTNPVLVQRTSNGYGTLTGTVTLSCRTYTVTKNLSPITITLTPNNSNECGGTATVQGATGTFTWTVDGNLLIDGTSSTLTTTSNEISFTGTAGSVQVVGGDCSINVSEYFAPFQPEIHFAVNPAYGSEPLSASVHPYNYSYTAVRWYLNGSLAESGSEHYFNSSPPCGFSEVTVEIDLGCGFTVTGTATFERYCGGWWRSMVIYPNPANSYLNIQPDAEKFKSLSTSEKSAMKEYEASLYDISGKLLLKGRSNGYKLNLDTRHLKSDNYFIHIKIDGEKELIKKQVMIRN
ncbi:T9SS type A sorting domain-containing protein [Pedobacter sp. ASV28]|uniref:T9SS type A sorting domain-containing protein n=1 Tax=Pedobacter sp. ASV28 TaxID=2795123 RepID=UPI0018ED738E|nr:T9SS type A sorting domain-containing protein [Pedobacter sp. ASV28]